MKKAIIDAITFEAILFALLDNMVGWLPINGHDTIQTAAEIIFM
jgi:hypothetical protein